MNAIFGCLLSLGGGGLLIQDLASSSYRSLWLPVLLLSVGLFMLLRHRPDDDPIDQDDDASLCATCRGAGTVYSDEWNDWRRSGPIRNIRELCPSCEGRQTPAPAAAGEFFPEAHS